MEKVPESVMIEEILLKLPVNSLVNLRYVSKDLWRLITSPSFIQLHLRHSIAQLNNNNNPNSLLISCPKNVRRKRDGVLVFQPEIHNYVYNLKSSSTFTTTRSVEILETPFESTEIRASCNGLLYLHQRLISWINGRRVDDIISYYIWNPCTKEYKQLPPPPPVDHSSSSSSSSCFCGFGYDRNNDEYKILHYENRAHSSSFVYGKFGELQSIIEFKLYTLGKNTWTRIAADNIPYRSFYFKEPSIFLDGSNKIGLLVNGALHWIMTLSDPAPKSGKIISFDIEKEVFREVQRPPYYSSSKEEEEEEEEEIFYYESLQTLQECLCMCQIHLHDGGVNKIDIWMLQDYNVMDSWTKLFRVVIPARGEKFDYYQFILLRYCENGEIVIMRNYKDVIVYDPTNHKVRCAKKFNESIAKWGKYYMDYTESLVCLNSGTYTDRAS